MLILFTEFCVIAQRRLSRCLHMIAKYKGFFLNNDLIAVIKLNSLRC